MPMPLPRINHHHAPKILAGVLVVLGMLAGSAAVGLWLMDGPVRAWSPHTPSWYGQIELVDGRPEFLPIVWMQARSDVRVGSATITIEKWVRPHDRVDETYHVTIRGEAETVRRLDDDAMVRIGTETFETVGQSAPITVPGIHAFDGHAGVWRAAIPSPEQGRLRSGALRDRIIRGTRIGLAVVSVGLLGMAGVVLHRGRNAVRVAASRSEDAAGRPRVPSA